MTESETAKPGGYSLSAYTRFPRQKQEMRHETGGTQKETVPAAAVPEGQRLPTLICFAVPGLHLSLSAVFFLPRVSWILKDSLPAEHFKSHECATKTPAKRVGRCSDAGQ